MTKGPRGLYGAFAVCRSARPLVLWAVLCTLSGIAVPPAMAQEDDPATRVYPNREAAAAAAEELRERGIAVRIEEASELRPGSLFAVQLRGFPRWADAQRAVNTLRERRIDAFAFRLPDDRGYAVSAGAFASIQNADAMVMRVIQAGYREVYTLRLDEEVAVYRLVYTDSARGREAASSRAVPAASEPGDVLFFGAGEGGATPSGPAGALRAAAPSRLSAGLGRLHLEGGWPVRSDDADASHYFSGSAWARWRPEGAWEAQATVRLLAWYQDGGSGFDRAEVDYGETWLRYRADSFRVTLGAQTVLWGRADEVPPTDRLSVQDATRFALDDLADRRRAVPALRLEGFHDDWKADLLWVPWFREAELPHEDSIWHPVNRRAGTLIGIAPDPVLAALVGGGTFAENDDGSGGIGLRVGRAGRGLDFALTLQRVRHSLPYYELDDAVRAALAADPADPAAALAAGGPTFTARHPWTTVVGGDVGLAAGSATWRFEAAWLSDVPVTTLDLRMETVKAIDWATGVEFFPGDADTRATLQLIGRSLIDAPEILDRGNAYSLGGEVETILAGYRWRARMRFAIGLDERDVYLNPELAWIAREPHEFYLAWHHFDGDRDTPGGFYDDNDLMTAGWRARY